MTADDMFQAGVYVALPAAMAYPLIYAWRVRWWGTWIGRALLTKALGVAMLLMVSALYQLFGQHYWGRDTIRVTGMALVTVGVWLALAAMLRELTRRDPTGPEES